MYPWYTLLEKIRMVKILLDETVIEHAEEHSKKPMALYLIFRGTSWRQPSILKYFQFL